MLGRLYYIYIHNKKLTVLSAKVLDGLDIFAHIVNLCYLLF